MTDRILASTLACIAPLLLAVPSRASEPIASAYTTHDYPKCRLVEKDTGFETRECPGYAGIPVRWTGEDDGTSVEFGRKGADDGLGQDFTVAHETIEWRGPVRAGRIAPFAAIVRIDALQSIAGPVRSSNLVVFKLDGSERSCIVAVVDGRRAGANAAARAAADAFARAFRCGKDARRQLGA